MYSVIHVIASMCSCGYKYMYVSACVYVCYWYALVFRWVCAFDRPNNTEGTSIPKYALVYRSVDSSPEGSEKQHFPHVSISHLWCNGIGPQVFWRIPAVLNDPRMKHGDTSLLMLFLLFYKPPTLL